MVLKDGREAVVRSATDADWQPLARMYESFEPKRAALGLPPLDNQGEWLTEIKAACGVHWVVAVEAEIVGHGTLCSDNESAEFALFIHQAFRGQGLGAELLGAMLEHARRRKLCRVWGITESDNYAVLRLATEFGFRLGPDASVVLDLDRCKGVIAS